MIDEKKALITMNEGTLGEGGKRLGHFKPKKGFIFHGISNLFLFKRKPVVR